MYISPLPAVAETDRTHDAHPADFYALPAATKLRWLGRYVRPGRLLEVGAGEGDFLETARAFGHSIAATEADPNRADRLQRRLGVEVECAFIERSRWPDRSFDVVYHCDLLSHFEDPRRALRSMARLLRPGGCLFFEVGLMAEVSPVWYGMIGGLGIPAHRWFFSERALVRLLADCGMHIERRICFSLAPVHVIGYAAERVRAVLRRIRGSDAEHAGRVETAPSAGVVRLRRIANTLRYGFAGLARWGGPQTALFIARPSPALEIRRIADSRFQD
jgi:SAM-dependent methyltransferase